MLEALLDGSGYVAELQAEHSVEAEGRLENLAELVGAAAEFDTVDAFLEQVSLVADTDELDADESSVVLMTLHSAKGLEFPNVFIIGLEDGVFPHLRSLGEPDELEEERRLAYVGITRARERLYLTHAWSRMLFGSTQYNPPSRFLDEIPANLVTTIEGRRRPSRSSGSGWGDDRWSGGGSGRRSSEGRDRIVEAAMRPQGPDAERRRGDGTEGGRRRAPQQVGRGRDPRHRRRRRQDRGGGAVPRGGGEAPPAGVGAVGEGGPVTRCSRTRSDRPGLAFRRDHTLGVLLERLADVPRTPPTWSRRPTAG